MKRSVYILLFVVLGVIVSFLVHAAIEMSLIQLFDENFPVYGLGWSWDTWLLIHHIGSAVLFVAGLGIGFWQGVYWWGVLYEHKPR